MDVINLTYVRFFIHEPSNLGIYTLVSVGLGEVYERTFISTLLEPLRVFPLKQTTSGKPESTWIKILMFMAGTLHHQMYFLEKGTDRKWDGCYAYSMPTCRHKILLALKELV